MQRTDPELISAYLKGDEDAFGLLMSRYQESLYGLVRSIVLDQEDARDITQKAFIKAFSSLATLRKKEGFKAWLFKIAVNLSRDHLRTKKEHKSLEPWMGKEARDCPEKRMQAREIKENIKKALHSLPPRQQVVVSLRLLKGLSFQEIANYLGIRESTARTNFYFGIRGIRNFLENRGLRP